MEKNQTKNKKENNQPIQEQSLAEFLKQKITEKNLDFSQLAENLEIKKEYLAALIEDDFKNLPPDIYVRGILFKLASYFKLEGDFLWELYKKEKQIKPEINNLPFNKKSKKINFFRISFWFFIVLASGIIILYQALNLLAPPKIELFTPKADSVIESKQIEIRGRTNANLLKINNKEINVDENGNFSFKINLMPGLNVIKIEAENKFGKETIVERKIIYQEKQIQQETENGKENKENKTEK